MSAARDIHMFRPKGRPTTTLDQGRILAATEDVHLLEKLNLHTLDKAMGFDGGSIARDAGPRKTYRVETDEGVLFVKVHRDVSFIRRMALMGRKAASPAHVEWDAIGMLRKTGFDVPEPVAFGEDISLLGCPRRSFIVTREVAGPQLDQMLENGYPNPNHISERLCRDQVLHDVAGMVRRFHSTGFYHKDLYCCHLIVTKDPRWGRPFFIDLERVDRGFPPRRRWLVKDLAALNYSAPATVTRADRLRFLLRYLSKTRLDKQAKHCVRDIEAKTARIAAHVPKYG